MQFAVRNARELLVRHREHPVVQVEADERAAVAELETTPTFDSPFPMTASAALPRWTAEVAAGMHRLRFEATGEAAGGL